MNFWINNVLVTGFLSVCSLQDIRHKSISVFTFLVGGILTLGTCIAEGLTQSLSVADAALGLGVGIIFLLVAYCSKEKIGLGDGMMLCVCGPLVGIGGIISILLIGLILAALIGSFISLKKREHLKTAIPFAPFLLAGAVGSMILQGGLL